MTYHVVIGGCRDFNEFSVFCEFVDACLRRIASLGDICIISGTCRGTDTLGERYAAEHGYAVRRFPADWAKHGPAAGPIRNREMVEAADFVIAFWDGKSRGTASLIACAKELNRPLRVKRI